MELSGLECSKRDDVFLFEAWEVFEVSLSDSRSRNRFTGKWRDGFKERVVAVAGYRYFMKLCAERTELKKGKNGMSGAEACRHLEGKFEKDFGLAPDGVSIEPIYELSSEGRRVMDEKAKKERDELAEATRPKGKPRGRSAKKKDAVESAGDADKGAGEKAEIASASVRRKVGAVVGDVKDGGGLENLRMPTAQECLWIFDNFDAAVSKATPENAPSGVAWGFLMAARKESTMLKMLAERVVPKSFIEEGDVIDREAKSLCGIDDKIRREFGEYAFELGGRTEGSVAEPVMA